VEKRKGVKAVPLRDEEAPETEAFCRICLGGKEEDECGDLLTPCNCTGSLRYVHNKCFETWTKNGPTMPEAGPIVTTIFGLLALTGYYWLCMRIRCELCGAIYRVKKVRLHWLMRWMVFLVLLSALIVTCGLFIRTGPVLFRSPYATNLQTDKINLSLARVQSNMHSMTPDESPRFICFRPRYRKWLHCFEVMNTDTRNICSSRN